VQSGQAPRRVPEHRSSRRRRVGPGAWVAAGVAVALVAGGLAGVARDKAAGPAGPAEASAPPTVRAAAPVAPTTSPPAARITLAFAGDVHFAERTATRLSADPTTAFGEAATALRAADLTMVNLETAVTDGGSPEPKEFHFRTPASAFAALRAAGADVATMANNHAADYGPVGLADTLAAIRSTRFPTIGIGADAARAYAPYLVRVRGHRVALLAASQVRDRTLAAWSAGASSPGIASAYDDRLVAAVRAARDRAEIVVVYLHWGVEGQGCPSGDQRALAARLAAAGADAVVGTHAHLLLGAGWLGPTYVAYGLGNYLWWRNGAYSDDTGVLRLTFVGRRVVGAALAPARIDRRGVPVPATGDTATRIQRKWANLAGCTGLAAAPS
jgi:poly-gamma-glutamate capsule biosynthesis protein CapA/YwtB (metallophosphatase superfamily)